MSLTPPDTASATLPPSLLSPNLADKAPASARRSALRVVLRLAVGGVVAALSLLLFAWLTLHWGILPHIERWRGTLEAEASRALGAPVRLGRITVTSGGWVPSLELRDVTILDPAPPAVGSLGDAVGTAQRVALHLPKVLAALSPRSLLAFDLRFEQLFIEGAHLEVRRDARGRIFVAGLELSPAADSDNQADNPAANWFFRQHELVIQGGSLRWTDEQRGAPPLQLDQVQLVVRNGLRRHELRLDATPPHDWGDRFTLRGRFTSPLLSQAGDWRRWAGTLYAHMPRADVSQLSRHVTLPFALSEGHGAWRAWVDWRDGQPQAATVDVALRAVTAQLATSSSPASATPPPPLSLAQIEGRLVGQRSPGGATLALQQFGFVTTDGVRWPLGDLSLQWLQPKGQASTGGHFKAQRLDLGLIVQVASRLPLGDAMNRLLTETQPQGIVSDLDLRWSGPLDKPSGYQVQGQLSGLSLAPKPAADGAGIGRPGLRNASITLNANERNGSAGVLINGGMLELPGVFDDPVVPLDQLAAQLKWQVDPAAGALPQINVQVTEARFGNADASGVLSARWTSGPAGAGARAGAVPAITPASGASVFGKGLRYPGQLELDARIERVAASRTARYLPLGVPVETRHYLAQALQGGSLNDVTLRVKGDLWDFPFDAARQAPAGEFRVTARAEDVVYDAVPALAASADAPAQMSRWPAFSRVNGDVVIDRDTLSLRAMQAQVRNVQLSQIQGEIRSLGERSTLVIDGQARGPLADMLRYVNETPVAGWTQGVLGPAAATGAADLKLALSIPLWDTAASVVKGSVTLAGNDVRLAPGTPWLSGARGRVAFTHKGFNVIGASARVWGGDASFEGGTQPDGSLLFSGQGLASADGLRRATELGAVVRLAESLSGQAAYRLALGFVRGQTEINLSSNLVGLAVDLPAPLRKAADTPLPLRYQTRLMGGARLGDARLEDTRAIESPSPGAPLQDTLLVELGTLLKAQYQRDLSGPTPRVVRGGIGLSGGEGEGKAGGELMPTPAAGVAANLALANLDLDAWESVATRLLAPRATAQGAPEAAGSPALSAAPRGLVGSLASDGAGYLPSTLALRAAELELGTRKLTRVVAGVSHNEGLWRVNLNADQVDGYAEYRPARRSGAANSTPASSGGSPGLVYARLARLSLPQGEAEQVENLLERAPTSVPALDIVIEDFELRGKRLGRLEVEAVNRISAEALSRRDSARSPAPEWQLQRLALVMPEGRLSATGNWSIQTTGAEPAAAAAAARRRALMNFKLEFKDGGALLERLGMGKAIRGAKGAMTGQVSWLGSPLALHYPSLTGQMSVEIESGQFLKAEPGAARLLGVLSLQALPRRLLLDFRDVFQEGFAFDTIAGEVTITEGIASTNNLRMRGVQAAVLMEGRADLARETQDLRVLVVPEINAGTASLAYAVVNPAVGLGTFIAQWLLRRPLTLAGTREFRVTGPWADPQVEPVERQPGTTLPDIDAPLPPASGASPATTVR